MSRRTPTRHILGYLSESRTLTDTVIRARLKKDMPSYPPCNVRPWLDLLVRNNMIEVAKEGFVCRHYRLSPLYGLAAI
jgi:hypothetical protein